MLSSYGQLRTPTISEPFGELLIRAYRICV